MCRFVINIVEDVRAGRHITCRYLYVYIAAACLPKNREALLGSLGVGWPVAFRLKFLSAIGRFTRAVQRGSGIVEALVTEAVDCVGAGADLFGPWVAGGCVFVPPTVAGFDEGTGLGSEGGDPPDLVVMAFLTVS